VAYRAICFSGPDGALMREVARRVSERVGFSLVDAEIVSRAAAEAGVDPSAVADVEKRRSFVRRAIEALATGTGPSPVFVEIGAFAPSDAIVSEEMRDLIRQAIEEEAARGSVVIVAHAASHALASQPDVLRVLVTASPPVRSSRVAAERDLDEKAATRVIEESDSARADYLKRFYGARSELPTQYDLVVNTDRVSVDAAVALVERLAAGG
jgi:cytidylate kinase